MRKSWPLLADLGFWVGFGFCKESLIVGIWRRAHLPPRFHRTKGVACTSTGAHDWSILSEPHVLGMPVCLPLPNTKTAKFCYF